MGKRIVIALGGNALGDAFTYGRIAGESAATAA